ncbi:MAG: ribonuclease P protein component [Candidatus Paceibacteria bacterium]
MSKTNIKQLFNEVLKKGKSYHSPHVSLKVLSVARSEKSSFYFVVSGKVIKKAVKRNLFKRRGRSIARQSGAKPGYVGAFFAKKGAGALEFAEFKAEILDLLKKAKLI